MTPAEIRLLKTVPCKLNLFGVMWRAFTRLQSQGLVNIDGVHVTLTEAGKKAIAVNQPS